MYVSVQMYVPSWAAAAILIIITMICVTYFKMRQNGLAAANDVYLDNFLYCSLTLRCENNLLIWLSKTIVNKTSAYNKTKCLKDCNER